MNAVWVCFKFNPTHTQPQKRLTLTGWMSTAHWNGKRFRSGEWGTLTEQLSVDEQNARDKAEADEQTDLGSQFGEMVLGVEEICKPRMIQREEAIKSRKLKALKKNMAQPSPL